MYVLDGKIEVIKHLIRQPIHQPRLLLQLRLLLALRNQLLPHLLDRFVHEIDHGLRSLLPLERVTRELAKQKKRIDRDDEWAFE